MISFIKREVSKVSNNVLQSTKKRKPGLQISPF